jgi:hypothetical protein
MRKRIARGIVVVTVAGQPAKATVILRDAGQFSAQLAQ